jgi:hypothetical protein
MDALLFVILGLLFLSPGISAKRVESCRRVKREAWCVRLTALILIFCLLNGRPHWWTLALETSSRSEVPQLDRLEWRELHDGFQVADVEVRFRDVIVDVWHMARIDPRNHRFEVHVSRPGLTIEDWHRKLNATLLMNGSYYLHDESPETPVKSNGSSLGPSAYTSNHGALILDQRPSILELSGVDAAERIKPFRNALVSYPLLLSKDSTSRAGGHDDWLANRSFVGIDSSGALIFVTTSTGFFSLRRLGTFLREKELNLVNAINLDGGPVAAQMVRSGSYQRTIRGRFEARGKPGLHKALHQRISMQNWKLPIVIAAFETPNE